MSITVSKAVIVEADKHDPPEIGYHSWFNDDSATVTSSSSNYGNAIDWLTYDAMTGTGTTYIQAAMPYPVQADYWAIHGYDLPGGTRVNVYADSTVVDTVVIGTNQTMPIMRSFDRTRGSTFKLEFVPPSSSDDVSVSVVALGEKLVMERGAYVGLTPPTMGKTVKVLPNYSQTGEFIGRSIVRMGVKGVIKFDHLTPGWVRDKLNPFIDHIIRYGWFLKWAPNRYPDEVVYCWTNDVPQPTQSTNHGMAVDIRYDGRTE